MGIEGLRRLYPTSINLSRSKYYTQIVYSIYGDSDKYFLPGCRLAIELLACSEGDCEIRVSLQPPSCARTFHHPRDISFFIPSAGVFRLLLM